jgi:alcohol dehydrogenase-like protein
VVRAEARDEIGVNCVGFFNRLGVLCSESCRPEQGSSVRGPLIRRRERDASLFSLPFIPGWDVSGAVESVGSGVTKFEKGDDVYGAPMSRTVEAGMRNT